MSALDDIESLLKRTMGLDAASIGSATVEAAVRQRLAACQLPGFEAYRDFEAVDGGWRIGQAPRRRVQFRHGNVLDADFVARLGVYHAIFCRNVLIYFDVATQQQVLAALEALLAPDGLLFVAPAESGLLLGYGFRPMQDAAACVFRKGREARPAAPKPLPPHEMPRAIPPRAVVSAVRGAPVVAPAPSAADSDRSRDEIVRQADQGRLAEADRQAREFLERHGPSVAAFLALGLICDASRKAHDAAMYFRKVLYLDPKHHVALVHLALTLEQLGDASGAELFRARARRLHAREQRP